MQGNKMQEKREKKGKEKTTRKESNIFNSNRTGNACVSTSTQAALQDVANVRTHCKQLPASAGRESVVTGLNLLHIPRRYHSLRS